MYKIFVFFKRIKRILLFIILLEMAVFTSEIRLGGWVVYWDKSGFNEIGRYGELFDRISLFALELNENGEPVLKGLSEEQIEEFIKLSKIKKFSPWITIVNDLRKENKKTILKDNKILKKIFNNSKTRKKHFNGLLEIIKRYGFKGLDLDFENIKMSEKEEYRKYIIELASMLRKNKIKLKVIVEPIKGPLPYWGTMNLLVMSYNMHGNFTGPGPRSTPEFIRKLKKRVEGDAKNMPSVSIVTEGFFWQKRKDVVRSLWSDSQKYLNSKNIQRDEKSKVPFLKYENGDELWFEDPISLEEKIKMAVKSGFKEIMIWYIGSSDESLYNLLKKYGRTEER